MNILNCRIFINLVSIAGDVDNKKCWNIAESLWYHHKIILLNYRWRDLLPKLTEEKGFFEFLPFGCYAKKKKC